MTTDIAALLGDEAETLLNHECKGITADELTLPGPDYIDRVFLSTRPAAGDAQPGHACTATAASAAPATSRSCRSTKASSTRPRRASPRTRSTSTRRTSSSWPSTGGCIAVATTLGGLGVGARRYAHKIPFIVKLNHNDFLHYPHTYDQVMFGSVQQAVDLGAVGVGATIYFGSPEADRQLHEVARRLRRGPPPRNVHGALVLPAEPGIQDSRGRLSMSPPT